MTNLPDPFDFDSMKNLTAADLRKLRAKARKREAAANTKLKALEALIAKVEKQAP